MDGILVLDKPAGYTSFDCVAIARRAAQEKRTGHTGTLDPEATGVLAICFGKATRLIEYMDYPPKVYRCGCLLGLETSTYDVWGEKTGGIHDNADDTVNYQWPGETAVREALKGLTGDIEQRPPMYSAIKVGGKKLYQYAREGKTVEVPARRVTIHSIELLSYDEQKGELAMDVTCSRGTYIRSLCHDLGKSLGTCACMSSLRRLSACGFTLDQAITIDELKTITPEELQKKLLPPEYAVKTLPRIELNDTDAAKFLNGVMDLSTEASDDTVFSVWLSDTFLGIAITKQKKLKAHKVFK